MSSGYLIEQAVTFPLEGGAICSPIVYTEREPLQDVLIKRVCARRAVRQQADDRRVSIAEIIVTESRRWKQ